MESLKEQKRDAAVEQIHAALDGGVCDILNDVLRGLPKAEALELCSRELKPYGTALHHAAGMGRPELVARVLDTGVGVNTRQQTSTVAQGQTALHIACLAGRQATVELLLSRGGDVNARESEGQSALHCACSGNDMGTIRVLLAGGANVNAVDERGESPLQRSILRSTTEITQCLMEAGADLSVTDSQGQTVLHYAAEWDNLELVKALLKAGLPVNAQDLEGCSALHLAESEEMRDFLVAHGGDGSLRDKCGRPALARRLDVEKEEYQRINSVLQRHLSFDVPTELPTVQGTSQSRVQERLGRMTLGDSGTEAPKGPVTSPLSAAGVLAELKQKADLSQ